LIGDPLLPALESFFGAFLQAHDHKAPGRQLATFLATTPDLRHRPELAEVAAFEWALATAAAAPEGRVVPPEELDGVPAESWRDMRVAFHASLVRVGTEWNSVALWRAVRQGTRLPPAVREPQARTWAVWRQDGATRFRPLPPDDAWALDLAFQGHPFGHICRELCHWLPPREAAPYAARMVGDWIDAGWVSTLVLPDH
jgi:hypothetical protein